MRVTDGMVKFMTVRVDEELRKAERPQGARGRWRGEAQAAGRRPAPRRAAGRAEEVAHVSSRWWRRPVVGGRRAAAAAGGGGRVAGAGGAARCQGRQGRGQALLLPAPEGLQVLRGQDRLRRLQGREAALGVRARARQDPAAAHVRHLRRAPAQADPGHQAGAQHRAAAVRRGLSASERRRPRRARMATAMPIRPERGAGASSRRLGGARGRRWAPPRRCCSAPVRGAACSLPFRSSLVAAFPLVVRGCGAAAARRAGRAARGRARGARSSAGRRPSSSCCAGRCPVLLIAEAMARGRGIGARLRVGLRCSGAAGRPRWLVFAERDAPSAARADRPPALAGVPGGDARPRHAAGAVEPSSGSRSARSTAACASCIRPPR